MEKVNDKWFKAHGWKKDEYSNKMIDDRPGYDNTTRHSVIYSLDTEDIHARFDMIVYIKPADKRRKKSVSRFYMFWAKGKNGFRVENRISHWRFPVETIENALTVVGYKED